MLDAVLAALRDRPALHGALEAVRRGEPIRIEGVAGSHRAAILVELQAAVRRPLAVAVPESADIEVLLMDLRAFHDTGDGAGTAVAFPHLDVDLYGKVPPHDDIVRERLQTLDRCLRGRADLLVAPVRSWMDRLHLPSRFRGRSLRLTPGTERPLEDLVRALLDAGYRRVSLVQELGEIAVRGGIVDVFPPTREHPVRIELWGDEVESLREFNPRDQRSMRTMPEVDIPPAAAQGFGAEEAAATAADPADLQASLCDYLEEPLWVEVEPETLDRDAQEWLETLDEHHHQALARGEDVPLPEELVLEVDAALSRRQRPRVEMAELAGVGEEEGTFTLLAQSAPGFRGRLADLAETLERSVAEGERVLFVLGQAGKAHRLAEILRGYDVPVAVHVDDEEESGLPPNALTPGAVWIGRAELSAGFRVPELGLWVGTDTELFGRARPPGRRRKFHGEAFEGDFRDLDPGDHVIHEEHGIGRFVGVKQISVGDAESEFMEIEYRGQDRLYLPLDQLYMVQKYRAGESAGPRVDKLGGTSWSRVKNRVKSSLREMAAELLELYAARKTGEGTAFGPDTPWQRELEESFEYEETPDQLAAIREVKEDMESPRVMDRLLCGDVGYGKTEVAMRAAFKAVMEGKQAAMLAPTTVLAHQHAHTLRQRYAAFPVKVELLSRFRSSTETKEAIRGMADGTIDVAVGTHRLLSRDVRFDDLGLLVVDEEQRFGVAQKERLKRLKREVDVLSMTATPIPRTLQMSLIGVRDLSVIETPPKDRYAIATHIVRWDQEVIATAIREELGRGGQVFFVHNRIETIYKLTATLRELVPEADFRVSHGQLPKAELERVMLDFVSAEADVLVTTAIIENGLDIPLANTIIVNRADRFGLAQLYQLRGRVGRSNRRAYAYLIVPPPDTLSEVAKKRLRAIQEFSDLGSGFRLAAMDLEIRGAGSLLGEKQHGHIAAVGFEMYARLLEEAVHELKGEPTPAEMRAQLNLGLSLQIPGAYVEDPVQRLMVSKRLASARRPEQLEALQEELRDRYGPLPSEVEALFAYGHVRLEAEELGILAVDRQGDRVVLRIGEEAPVDTEALLGMVRERPAWRLEPPDRLLIETGALPTARLVEAVRDLLAELPVA